MKEQAAVNQAVLSHIARWAREQATLWLLKAHTQCGNDVCVEASYMVSITKSGKMLQCLISKKEPGYNCLIMPYYALLS